MLGIGYQELFLIGLAALLLFGPGKLPEVMSQAGKWYKQFRDVTNELSGEFNKTVAEAKSEFEGAVGDLGPMQKELDSITKSVNRDLGGAAKGGKAGASAKKTTSTRATTSSSAKKSGTSSTTKSTTASKSGSKTTSAKATSSSGSKSSPVKKPTTTSSKPVVVASKDDPFAGVSMFEQSERKPKRRARSATPSMFTDLTPRDSGEDVRQDTIVSTSTERESSASDIDPNDPIARARQRRMRAGYAQATA